MLFAERLFLIPLQTLCLTPRYNSNAVVIIRELIYVAFSVLPVRWIVRPQQHIPPEMILGFERAQLHQGIMSAVLLYGEEVCGHDDKDDKGGEKAGDGIR